MVATKSVLHSCAHIILSGIRPNFVAFACRSLFRGSLLSRVSFPEAAPEDSVCINGQTGVQDPDTDVCCPLECGDFCGGEGCGTIPGVDASQCCAAAIIAAGVVCDGTTTPCVVIAGGSVCG